ncbi:hypothetical protein ABIA33_003444 [Streptacidiphilus sp. MAP12-16]|uniref:hypothetical protein n=1 Tax=Streptacidiphilus sp. MAP12-16 TaxID=3156300 RepID=UPI003515FBDA
MITIGGWHISAYELGQQEGSCTVYLVLALVGIWLGTMWWRDPKPSEVRGSEETARLERRRTRVVKYGTLAVSAAWVLTMVLTDVYAAKTG